MAALKEIEELKGKLKKAEDEKGTPLWGVAVASAIACCAGILIDSTLESRKNRKPKIEVTKLP